MKLNCEWNSNYEFKTGKQKSANQTQRLWWAVQKIKRTRRALFARHLNASWFWYYVAAVWQLNLQGILVRTFFSGFCLLLVRGAAPLLSPPSDTGLLTISFFSLSMRSGSATPFIAFRRLFSTFSGFARPRPPFKKLSYSATLLKHLMLGKGSGGAAAEYRASNGSNFSEQTFSSFASSSPVSASGPEDADAECLLSRIALFLSLSSMFETSGTPWKRGILGKLWLSRVYPFLYTSVFHCFPKDAIFP